MAIQEITRGYELIKRLRSILYLGGDDTQSSELPHGVLFEEALQALTVAITNLRSSTSPKSVEVSSVSLSDQGSEASNEIKKTPSSGCRKRGLRDDNPWTKITYAPHDDGHQWRKYGHKIIKKSKLSRSYYRCTYKDQGCLARKHVQQKDCNEPPLFTVTYHEKHTCKCNNNYPMISPHMTLDDLVPKEPNLFSFESNNANVIFSQERTVPYSSIKASTTQQDPEQQRVVDLQNKTIHKETMESVEKSDQDCLQAMLNTCVEGTIPAGACFSPPWLQVMCMDDLIME
ncbi:hypothetical protein J5N97_017431 [Dioscorea zingiberensis]|uniref:WRKY domain-containing protein n=1 Tax=Dioscorea zingiberensis TaxID=325984 RepID=A0A9D5HG48_9LILI|nr:hypothetical protein J5N97_017431 [Dioscorea zingiberensis]